MTIMNYEEAFNNLKELISSENDKYIFVCIGTDKCIGDAVGPWIGTLLEENGYKVIGTLEKPCHAVNMKERLKELKKNYKGYKVIVIDACIGKEGDIGKVVIEEGPLKPGRGLNKKLGKIGDIAVKVIVLEECDMIFYELSRVRLYFVKTLAEDVAKLIDNTFKSLKDIEEAALS